MKSKISDHQSTEWNGGKSEDEWIVEFVESNAHIFQEYLVWREFQDRFEHVESFDDIEDE
jgi:hypothetical protein